MVKLQLPKINARAFSTEFIKRKAARYLNSVLEPLGPEGLRWLIENKASIYDVNIVSGYKHGRLPQAARFFSENYPKLRELSKERLLSQMAQIRSYGWALRALSDSGLYGLLPEWARDIIATGQGQAWWQAQVAGTRKLFKGG